MKNRMPWLILPLPAALRLSPISSVEKLAPSPTLPISPLVGEMPGRAEGGAKDRQPLLSLILSH
ncbi:MAG: hypothetical protein EOR50_33785 [Mesorhizobium sp.]|nr:MAG: hypothetical protein EOR50_33785 [Mesorhizobium sp.]